MNERMAGEKAHDGVCDERNNKKIGQKRKNNLIKIMWKQKHAF